MENFPKGWRVSDQDDQGPQRRISRRDFLKLAAGTAVLVGGALILKENLPKVLNLLSPENNTQVSGIDAYNTTPQADASVSTPASRPATNIESDPKALQAQEQAQIVATPETEVPHIIENYNLWDTINLDNYRRPMVMIVVDNNNRVIVGSVAHPNGYTAENKATFDVPRSLETLSYLPWQGDPKLNRYQPHTWAHSGQLSIPTGDTFQALPMFAGEFEKKLRIYGHMLNTSEIVPTAKTNFDGATVFLCQARDPVFFGKFPGDDLVQALSNFQGNILTLKIRAMARMSPEDYDASSGDPVGFAQNSLKSDAGFGWNLWKPGYFWGLRTCGALTQDEGAIIDGKYHVIFDKRWYIGMEVIDRSQKVDVFS